MNPGAALAAMAIPLAGAAVVLVVGPISHRIRDGAAVAFGLATWLSTLPLVLDPGSDPWVISPWIPSLGIDLVLRPDALGTTVATLAAGLGSLVLLYSTAYMRKAEGEGYDLGRYYALVLLFIGAMVTLALAETLLLFYVAWEVVGLCSFALISFHHRDPAARRAGIKALVVTWFGDVGLLVAVVALWSTGGVVTFGGIGAAPLPPWIGAVVAVGFLVAAMGKSAQFPLHVWLPDAMEAPTPVSALIHAATMVNAGVYLLARVYPDFSGLGWWTSSLVGVGTLSALLGAVGAIAERDLKRVLAYSTVSHLGYMVAAIGVGALVAAQFHLVAQALFKALLFLAAGAVIQAAGTRDLYSLGGLRRSMPLTAGAFLVGTLAMVGIPPLVGFWGKDLMLEAVGAMGADVPLALLLLTTGLGVAYGWRAYHLVFGGEPGADHVARDPPRAMGIPLVVLAGAAALGGLLLPTLSAALASTVAGSTAMPGDLLGVATQLLAWPWGLLPISVTLGSAYLLFLRPAWLIRPHGVDVPYVRLVASGFLVDRFYGTMAAAIGSMATQVRRTQTGDLNLNTMGLVLALVAIVAGLLLGAMG